MTYPWLYTRLAAVCPPKMDVLAARWEIRAAFNVDPEPDLCPERGSHPRRMTVRQLHEMPDDGNRYELIGGELFVTPAPAPCHQ